MTGQEDDGDKTLVILQSLLCLLREKNLLSRDDIERLCENVRQRAVNHEHDPLPCRAEGVGAAATTMAHISTYIAQRYGGKRRRHGSL